MKTIDEAIECQRDLLEHYKKQLVRAEESGDEIGAAKIRDRINKINIAIEALWRLNPKARAGGKCPVCLCEVSKEQYYCSICGESLLNDENGGGAA